MIKYDFMIILIFSIITFIACFYSVYIIEHWNYYTFVSVCVASMELVHFTHISFILISILFGCLLGYCLRIITEKKEKK